MQGILKSNHERLCEYLQDVKDMEPAESRLTELEEQMKSLFLSYQEKMKELKRLVLAYEEKQKIIKNEIKRIKRNGNLQDSKKATSYAMSKVLVLFLLPMQSLIGIVSESNFNNFFQF